MASKYLQKFPVPEGFQEVLADFTREVLRAQPKDIVEFAVQYFEGLDKGKRQEMGSARKNDSISSKYLFFYLEKSRIWQAKQQILQEKLEQHSIDAYDCEDSLSNCLYLLI